MMESLEEIMGRFIVELYDHHSFFSFFACYLCKKDQFPTFIFDESQCFLKLYTAWILVFSHKNIFK
jgi:hypothetical protein